MGLRRSFQEAGARNVISSFWEVDDEGTALMMKEFYKRYFDDIPPNQSLREVKLDMLKEPRWATPYYWAAFSLVNRGM